MVDVDSEDSSSEEDERFTKEPLVTFEAPVNEEDSSSEDAEEEVFEFVKKGDEDKAEVILKSALVTDDQSSEDEAVEDGESQIAIPTEEVQQEEATANIVDTEEKQPVVNFDFDQQVQPADNRLNALDYPEDSGNADSSAPSSLESQSGPASVIVESQEVPTPDSAAFILTTTESSSLDNLPTPQEAVIEVLPGTEVAQSPILEESEELEDSDDKSAEIPIDILEPKETEQPTFDVIAPSTEEDLITEEKAALSSLEEAINSAAESDQEAIIESEVRPETPKDIDVIDGNSKELSNDVIDEPLVTNADPIDLLASIEQNGINEPLVEKVQENPALVKFEDNPLVETIQESFDEKIEEPVVNKEEAPTFEQIDEQSQIEKEIEVTNTDIIEKEDEQQLQTLVENIDTEIEKEDKPIVEKTESIVVDDEPSTKVEVQPTFEEPTVAVCNFEPVTDAFAKETPIEEQSALKVDDLIDTEPISIEKSEEAAAPIEITEKALDLLAAEIPIQEPVTFAESLIETKEIETLPESSVEVESRFQATPDDFEKEYIINVKEDQFNMSEAVPEPMPQPIVEEEPTIEPKEALETAAPVTTSQAAEIPIEEPIVDKDEVPTIEQTNEQQPQIEKEIEVTNTNLTEEQPKEPSAIEEVSSKIDNESVKVEEDVTPEIVVDEAPKIEQEEIVKPVEEPEAVKPVEEPEAVKIEPPSIEETPKEIPVEEPEKPIIEDKAAAAVTATAVAVAAGAGATVASKAVSKKPTSSTTTAGAKKAPLNKPGAKPTAAASPKPTRSTTSRAPLASRSTAASKPITSSTTSRTAPLTKKPVSAPSSRPSSATSKPPVPKADVKPRAKPVTASSSTAAPKTTRPTTTRATAPKPASPAPRVRPTNTVSKAPVPRTTTSRLASTAPKDDKKVNAVKSATPTTSRTASPVKARPTSGTTRAPPLKNGTADVKPRVTKAPVTSTRATTRSTVSSTTTKPATTKTTTTASRTATRPTASSTAARTTTRTTTTTKTVPATRKPISGAPNNRAAAGGPLAKKAAVTKTKPTPTNVAPEKKPSTKETEVAETKVNGDLNGHPEPATNGDAPKEVNVEI